MFDRKKKGAAASTLGPVVFTEGDVFANVGVVRAAWTNPEGATGVTIVLPDGSNVSYPPLGAGGPCDAVTFDQATQGKAYVFQVTPWDADGNGPTTKFTVNWQ